MKKKLMIGICFIALCIFGGIALHTQSISAQSTRNEKTTNMTPTKTQETTTCVNGHENCHGECLNQTQEQATNTHNNCVNDTTHDSKQHQSHGANHH